MPGPHLVSADELAQWAASKEAESLLPELITKLIRSEAVPPTRISTRTGSGTNLPGPDIEVQTSINTDHVPNGDSVWEVTTYAESAKKANADFDKSISEFPTSERANLAFVGVTLRRWGGKKRWVQLQDQKGWREVHYFDADDIHEWLLCCPAVHFWLSIRLGKDVCRVRTLRAWWDDWASTTSPIFDPKWLLAGRSHEVDEIRGHARSSQLFSVTSDSEDESLAFLGAALAASEDETDRQVLERAVVAESVEGFQYLCNACEQLLIVAKCDLDSSHPGQAVRKNRLALLQNTKCGAKVVLPKANVGELSDLLRTAGLSMHEAHAGAMKARNSLEHLRQRLGAPISFFLEIATSNTTNLTAALLVNRWNDESEADQAALARLTGGEYEGFRDWLTSLPKSNLPLVRKAGPVWFLTDAGEAWQRFGGNLSPKLMERFEGLATDVLAEDDPAFELEPDKRWTASILGKGQRFSNHIKEGIARSLGLLATQDPVLPGKNSGQNLAAYLVRILLQKATPGRWYALAPYLPVLAEAAPDEFLTAVEEAAAEGSSTALVGLVGADDSFMTSNSRICEVLWALERLAWSQENLPRAALALAAISELGLGKSRNNPDRSLREIFLPWHPCTNASVQERFRVIDLLRSKYPDASWRLMLTQIPELHSSAMQTSRPELRPWAAGDVKPQLQRDVYEAGSEALRRLIKDAGSDWKRWHELIDSTVILKGDWGSDPLEALKVASASLGEGDRACLWLELRKTWTSHVRHQDAEWAMDSETLNRFEEVLSILAPSDPVEQNIWLFEQWVELPEKWSREDHDHDADRARLAELRQGAIKSIFESEGIDGVFRLAEKVASPNTVGEACADLDIWTDKTEGAFLAENLDESAPARYGLAMGFAWRRFRQQDVAWLHGILSTTPALQPSQIGSLFLVAPVSRETWESVEKVSPEASKEYWQKVGRWHVTDSEGELEFALEKLLEVGRAHDVIDLLAMERVEESKPMPAEVALRAFELIRADLLKYKDVLGTIRDDMGRVIDRLAADPEIDLSRLARIEFYFTPILSILRPPAALGRALASDPAVLIELVSMAYRKEGEEPQDISDDEAGLASGAFRVLDNWRRLPGTANDGSIDGGELKSYIELVRELASNDEVRRLTSVDSVLGKVLSYAPSGEDGVWPCPAVCEVLEGADSETMENSFVIGKRNQRGVVGRSPYAGGELERELERKYADLAARIRTSYPKTASHLDRIAKAYAWDAKREDERADMQQDL